METLFALLHGISVQLCQTLIDASHFSVPFPFFAAGWDGLQQLLFVLQQLSCFALWSRDMFFGMVPQAAKRIDFALRSGVIGSRSFTDRLRSVVQLQGCRRYAHRRRFDSKEFADDCVGQLVVLATADAVHKQIADD